MVFFITVHCIMLPVNVFYYMLLCIKYITYSIPINIFNILVSVSRIQDFHLKRSKRLADNSLVPTFSIVTKLNAVVVIYFLMNNYFLNFS